jgi:hypothetical protein
MPKMSWWLVSWLRCRCGFSWVYRQLVPDDKIGAYTRVTQADGRPAWSNVNFVDLETIVKSAQGKGIRFIATGDYRGQAFKMIVPARANPGNLPVVVKTPFTLEPTGFDEAVRQPGATRVVDGQVHCDVQQRMLVSSARLVKMDKAGDAEYDLDGYCVDEDFAPPAEKASYVWSQGHQNIVRDEVKTALRAPGDFVDRSLCVWAAVAGSIAPGVCQ